MFQYPYSCPSCGKFGLRDGRVAYWRTNGPCSPLTPHFNAFSGEECIFCPSCEWHSETDSQKHERLFGESERLQQRIKEIEGKLGIQRHNTWVAANQAALNSRNLHRISQGQRPIFV